MANYFYLKGRAKSPVVISTLLVFVIVVLMWQNNFTYRIKHAFSPTAYRPNLNYSALEPDCIPLHFAKHPLPLVALASFPGSGNTWLRHLIQKSTGLYTGAVYNDISLKRGGFLGEHVTNGSVVVIKTHQHRRYAHSKYEKAVVLLRNPYDAILAFFNFHRAGHTGHAPHSSIQNNTAWTKFAENWGRGFANFVMDWMQFPRPIHIVHYENLLRDPWQELEDILKFLEVKYSPNTLKCAMDDITGKFKRKPTDHTEDPYTKTMRRNIDVYKRAADLAVQLRMVQDRGYKVTEH